MKPPTVVNRRKAKETVYIGRGSKWGNPFTSQPLANTKAQFQCATREESIERFEAYAREHLWDSLHELEGHALGCFCKPKACHGDVLVKLFDERFGEAKSAQQVWREFHDSIFSCEHCWFYRKKDGLFRECTNSEILGIGLPRFPEPEFVCGEGWDPSDEHREKFDRLMEFWIESEELTTEENA